MITGMVLFLVSCQNDFPERGGWTPAIEDTGFEYLNVSGERILMALQTGRGRLVDGNSSEAMASIVEAEDAVHVLLGFDVPMTEVRQLIYDAGRLHALKRLNDSLNHLHRSAGILDQIEKHWNTPVQHAIRELRFMISDLRILLEEENGATIANTQVELSRKVAAKFRELGEKINLLTLKSDLVLSGADYVPATKPQ
jgi:hypothetical protein